MSISNRPGSRARALLSFTIISAMMVSLLVSPSSASRRAAPPSHGEGISAIDGTVKTPSARTTSSEPSAEAEARAREAYGKAEMSFEPNRGQTDDEVKFLARGAGYTVFLTASEAVFVLANAGCPSESPAVAGGPDASACGV